MTLLDRPRLYLDLEGVILPFGRIDNTQFPFEMTELSGFEYYSPEVISRLGQTGMEIVWCTHWNEDLKEVASSLGAISTSRSLEVSPIGVGAAQRVLARLDALARDQTDRPKPFVWVDDAITDEVSNRVAKEFGDIPYLLVNPDKNIGVSAEELVAIEQFADIPAPGK